MKRHILFFLFLFASVWPLFPQGGTKTENDPQARKLLDQAYKRYHSAKSVEIGFTVATDVPEQKQQLENGSVIQAGKQYKLVFGQQQVISNGKITWVYDKKDKEIQINNVEEESKGAVYSPLQILGLYRKGDYGYALAKDDEDRSPQAQYIEFKPLSKNSDIAKIRLGIDKKTFSMKSGKIFYRDGTRMKVSVNRESFNKSYPSATFELNPKSIPGVHVEDLRIED